MIFDIRDYLQNPNTRELIIGLCEKEIFPDQEKLGAYIAGIFRDAEDPNRWIWLRGMKSLDSRKEILTKYYVESPRWLAIRTQVNTWLVNSDNVLLAKLTTELTPSSGATEVGMYTFLQKKSLDPKTLKDIDCDIREAIAKAGGKVIAAFEIPNFENNFPRHAARTGEYGVMVFASFKNFKTIQLPGVFERRLLPTETSRMR